MVFRHPPGRVAVMLPEVVEPGPDAVERLQRNPPTAAWRAPLWLHAVGLLLVLVAILPFTQRGPVWLADEGGMRLQAELLADGRGWELDRPFSDLDPEEVTVPIESATIDGASYTPFAKHVAASLLLGGAVAALGAFGFIVLSILATVVAAWVTGVLADRLHPGTGRWAFWLLGLGSPLVIYSYTSTSHTIGVALAAVAAAAAVLVLDNRWGWTVLLLTAVALGPLFRSEAVLFAAALAVAMTLFSFRPLQLSRMGVAASVAAAGAIGFATNLALEREVAGAVSVPIDRTAPGFIWRIGNAAATVLLRASDSPVGVVAVLTLAMFTVLLVIWLRVDPGATARHVFHAAGVVASAIVLLGLGTVHVYGIVLAVPAVWAGLAAVRSDVWSSTPYRLLLSVAALYALAVLATEDYGGGGVQWGGRYLFLALPAVIPVAVTAISSGMRAIEPRAATMVVAALIVGAGALTITSIRLLADRHEATGGVVEALADAAADVGPAGDGGGPILFSSFSNVGRMAWETVEDTRYLLMYEEDASTYIDRFANEPVERFLLLAANDAEVQQFEANGFVVADEVALIGPGRLLEMERPADD
jgi:hypothetical protein